MEESNKKQKKKRKNSEDLESNLMCGRNPSTCPDKGHAGLGLEGVFYQPLGCDQANRVGFSGFHGNPPAARPPARLVWRGGTGFTGWATPGTAFLFLATVARDSGDGREMATLKPIVSWLWMRASKVSVAGANRRCFDEHRDARLLPRAPGGCMAAFLSHFIMNLECFFSSLVLLHFFPN